MSTAKTGGDAPAAAPRAQLLPLHAPPPGPFSLSSLSKVGALKPLVRPAGWVGVRFRGARLPNFWAGEKAEAGTNTPPRQGGRGAGRPGEGVRYCCQRGYQRARKAKPAAQPAGGDVKPVRGRAILHGDKPQPLKLGCPWAYTVREHDDDTVTVCVDEALLLGGHNHDNSQPAKFFSPWIGTFIRDEWRRNNRVTPQHLVNEINATTEDMAACAKDFSGFHEVLEAYECGDARPSRDSFVDAKYVGGVLRKLRNDKSAVIVNDEGQDIGRWVSEHLESVTIYKPGEEIVEGEEEDVRSPEPQYCSSIVAVLYAAGSCSDALRAASFPAHRPPAPSRTRASCLAS